MDNKKKCTASCAEQPVSTVIEFWALLRGSYILVLLITKSGPLEPHIDLEVIESQFAIGNSCHNVPIDRLTILKVKGDGRVLTPSSLVTSTSMLTFTAEYVRMSSIRRMAMRCVLFRSTGNHVVSCKT